MSNFTVAANEISRPRAFDAGSIITVTASAGASALVEFSTANEAGVANGIAQWHKWPGGLVESTTKAEMLERRVHIRVTARGGSVTVDANENPSALSRMARELSWASQSNTIALTSQRFSGQRKPMLFVGDSLTYGASGRVAMGWDGTNAKEALITLANLGAASWIVNGWIASGPGGGLGGTLDHDGTGRVRWQATGDTYGEYVNCSQGGWFKIPSGTNTANAITIAVRGATKPPAAGTGAVTVGGIPNITDWNFLGFASHVAGALADTFTDYRCLGISGCTSADALKYLPQALSYDYEAVHIQIGVNDASNAITADKTVENVKAMIDYAAARVPTVTVGDIFPVPSGAAADQAILAQTSAAIRAYCHTKTNVIFVSAYDQLVDRNAWSGAGVTALTGVFADGLHFNPFGGHRAAQPLVEKLRDIYPRERQRLSQVDTYSATLQTGAWNINPTLRGTGGTVAGSAGITGTSPNNWSLTRSGTAQTCTTSFTPAADGGLDFYTMAVAAAASNDTHRLEQVANVPAGIAVGDFFRIVAEITIGATTAGGLSTFQVQANASGNQQAMYLFSQTRAIATFTTEAPVYSFTSEPQPLVAGVTGFTLGLRVGAAVGGTGTIGIRNFRIEKCAGPILYALN